MLPPHNRTCSISFDEKKTGLGATFGGTAVVNTVTDNKYYGRVAHMGSILYPNNTLRDLNDTTIKWMSNVSITFYEDYSDSRQVKKYALSNGSGHFGHEFYWDSAFTLKGNGALYGSPKAYKKITFSIKPSIAKALGLSPPFFSTYSTDIGSGSNGWGSATLIGMTMQDVVPVNLSELSSLDGLENVTHWNKSVNDAGGSVAAHAVVHDAFNDVYVGGYLFASGNKKWNIKKYQENGTQYGGNWQSINWPLSFTVASNDAVLYSLAIDNISATDAINLYAVGTGTGSNWRIKKYNARTGVEITTGWDKTIAGGLAYGVATDMNGSVYVAGIDGSSDMKLYKYNTAGTEQWSKTFTTSTVAQGFNPVFTDAYGWVYLVGKTDGGDFKIKRFDSAGTEDTSQFDLTVDSGGTDQARAATVDFCSQRLYVVGTAGNDWWIKKYYTVNGTELTTGWAKTLDGSGGVDVPYSVGIDSHNNVHVAGYTTNSSGSTLWWIKKFNAVGTQQWDKKLWEGGNGKAYGLVSDMTDKLYVVGEFNTDWWIKKFDSGIKWGREGCKYLKSGATIPPGTTFNKTYDNGTVETVSSGVVLIALRDLLEEMNVFNVVGNSSQILTPVAVIETSFYDDDDGLKILPNGPILYNALQGGRTGNATGNNTVGFYTLGDKGWTLENDSSCLSKRGTWSASTITASYINFDMKGGPLACIHVTVKDTGWGPGQCGTWQGNSYSNKGDFVVTVRQGSAFGSNSRGLGEKVNPGATFSLVRLLANIPIEFKIGKQKGTNCAKAKMSGNNFVSVAGNKWTYNSGGTYGTGSWTSSTNCASNGGSGCKTCVLIYPDSQECDDGVDNDGDGWIDHPADPGCQNVKDDSETNDNSASTAECNDGVDNDNDALIDGSDPGCSNSADDSENTATTQCQDTADNDGDGMTDAADASCWTNTSDPTTYLKTRNNEASPLTQCQDTTDNDNDNAVDAADPGCWVDATNSSSYNVSRNSEGASTFHCSDTIDNDDDGQTDFPNDIGCQSPTDPNEANSGSESFLVLSANTSATPPAGSYSFVVYNTGETINFFANYSNASSLEPITGATCDVTIGSVSTDQAMTYDSNIKNYKYSRSFTTAGTYAWDVNCTKSPYDQGDARTGIAIYSKPPTAAFSAPTGSCTVARSGRNPLTVTLTDSSSGSPTVWQWDFTNDGTYDTTNQSPTVEYRTVGTKTVTLNASNDGGWDEETKTNYITVNPDPGDEDPIDCSPRTIGNYSLVQTCVESITDANSYFTIKRTTQDSRAGLSISPNNQFVFPGKVSTENKKVQYVHGPSTADCVVTTVDSTIDASRTFISPVISSQRRRILYGEQNSSGHTDYYIYDPIVYYDTCGNALSLTRSVVSGNTTVNATDPGHEHDISLYGDFAAIALSDYNTGSNADKGEEVFVFWENNDTGVFDGFQLSSGPADASIGRVRVLRQECPDGNLTCGVVVGYSSSINSSGGYIDPDTKQKEFFVGYWRNTSDGSILNNICRATFDGDAVDVGNHRVTSNLTYYDYDCDRDDDTILERISTFASYMVLNNGSCMSNYANVCPNNAPVLSNPTVSPSKGGTSTTFTFQVTYTDADNDKPDLVKLKLKKVADPESEKTMTEVDSGDTDYTDGKLYQWQGQLSARSHKFYFIAFDWPYRSNIVGTNLGHNPDTNTIGSTKFTVYPSTAVTKGWNFLATPVTLTSSTLSAVGVADNCDIILAWNPKAGTAGRWDFSSTIPDATSFWLHCNAADTVDWVGEEVAKGSITYDPRTSGGCSGDTCISSTAFKGLNPESVTAVFTSECAESGVTIYRYDKSGDTFPNKVTDGGGTFTAMVPGAGMYMYEASGDTTICGGDGKWDYNTWETS